MDNLSSCASHNDHGRSFVESGILLAIEAELLTLLNDFNTHGCFVAFHIFVKCNIETNILSSFSRLAIGQEALLLVLLRDLQVDAGVCEVLQVVFESHEELAIVLILPVDLSLDSGSPVVGVFVAVVSLEFVTTPGVADVNELLIFAVPVLNLVSG